MSESGEVDWKDEYIVHLARLGLAGRSQEVLAYVRKISRKMRNEGDALAEQLNALLVGNQAAPGGLRDASTEFLPVDADSRLSLLRIEYPSGLVRSPILEGEVAIQLDQLIGERRNRAELDRRGLEPARTALFVGPPGVGKTMSARWVADQLSLPLLTLDLATVMSSYLGKTGSNIRTVLDYAKSIDCVLLIDEIDSIAKKRDDSSDVGELKRLVTVLLQEVDEWPSRSLLISATNHPELLDPAIWRRFDQIVTFSTPTAESREKMILSSFGEDSDEVAKLLPMLVQLWSGESGSNIARRANWIRRRSAIGGIGIQESLLETIGEEVGRLPLPARRNAIRVLTSTNLSDRQISAASGVSRDTLRKYRATDEGNG